MFSKFKSPVVPCMIAILAFVCGMASGCATARTEALPEGPRGDSIMVLSQHLRNDESPTVRVASALALGRIGSRYPDVELVEAMNSDPSIQVKMAAIRSLGMLGGDRAKTSLNEYYRDYSYARMGTPEKAVLEELKSAIEKAGKGGGSK